MPIAALVYTLRPLKGVAVARNCIEDLSMGIWKKLLVKSDLMMYFHPASLRKTSFGETNAVGRILHDPSEIEYVEKMVNVYEIASIHR